MTKPNGIGRKPFKVDLRGQKFARLTVVEFAGQKRWKCICECGRKTLVDTRCLRSGNTKSCGCLRKDNKRGNPTHGGSRTPEFVSWTGMWNRCTNPKDRCFNIYGGLGVTICDRWKSFENFLSDMGPRPTSAHSLDRFPNRSGNYEPENCRWATTLQQNRNKRTSTFYTVDGITACLTEHAERVGLKQGTVRGRLARGWSIERALGKAVST